MNTTSSLQDYLKQFENVDENIIKMIIDDTNDELTLCRLGNSYFVVDDKLLELIKSIEKLMDFHHLDKVDGNMDIKMMFVQLEKNYNQSDNKMLNKYFRLVIKHLFKHNEKNITDYLKNHIKDSEDLIKYGLIMKNGWLKPKFNIIEVLLNNF